MIGPVPQFCFDCGHRYNCVAFEEGSSPDIMREKLKFDIVLFFSSRDNPVKCAKMHSFQHIKEWQFVPEFKKLIIRKGY